jgi:hypothetical protein
MIASSGDRRSAGPLRSRPSINDKFGFRSRQVQLSYITLGSILPERLSISGAIALRIGADWSSSWGFNIGCRHSTESIPERSSMSCPCNPHIGLAGPEPQHPKKQHRLRKTPSCRSRIGKREFFDGRVIRRRRLNPDRS